LSSPLPASDCVTGGGGERHVVSGSDESSYVRGIDIVVDGGMKVR